MMLPSGFCEGECAEPTSPEGAVWFVQIALLFLPVLPILFFVASSRLKQNISGDFYSPTGSRKQGWLAVIM